MTQMRDTELLHCGSPVFDPVCAQLRCPDGGHVMKKKEIREYDKSIDGIMCNFCATTVWFTDWPSRTKEGCEPVFAPGEPTYFLHCHRCNLDVCEECEKEIIGDDRYHLPCMRCTRCGTFMREEEAVLHHCAVSTTAEEKQVALRVKRQRSPILLEAGQDGRADLNNSSDQHQSSDTLEWCVEITTSVPQAKLGVLLGVIPSSLQLIETPEDPAGEFNRPGPRASKQLWRILAPTRLYAEGVARKAKLKSLNARVSRL
jgi:uncharacterized C2H2 Zn-finger protein